MGLWEFLRQWQRGRIVAGLVLSVLVHVLAIMGGLWGLAPELAPRWRTKPGDSLIVELRRPEETAAAGTPAAPPPPATPPPPAAPPAPATPPVTSRARVEAKVEAKPTPPAPPREERRAPAPRPPEPPRRVARAPEPPPRETLPAPRVPEPPPAAAEPVPQPPAPEPQAVEPTPRAPEATPAPSEPGPRTAPTPEPRRGGAERQIASLPPPGGAARPSLHDVRAALRAGSGGVGRGRGGIEGDPIPLDSSDARFSDYLEQVRRKITEKWGFPCVKNLQTRECEVHTTSLDVQFGILKDGRVQFVEVVRLSDHAEYDDYAVRAILLAQPYPPVPPAMLGAMKAGSTGLAIRARFSYVVESSLTKFLR